MTSSMKWWEENTNLLNKKSNFVNNKDLLEEIHKSKTSYCEYTNEKYTMYDIILDSIDEINDETLSKAKQNRATRLSKQAYEVALKSHKSGKKPSISEFTIDPSTISEYDLVFRITTYEHIPLAPGRKKNPKNTADYYVKLNFVPFKHYIIEQDEEAKTYLELSQAHVLNEVLRSHSKDGKFCDTHGKITDKLAQMFMLMVYKYSQRANWRGYTYLDEMVGQALLQLSYMGLKFNEAKSNNPFSYFTASMANSFTKILNTEKKNQNIRDDLLVDAGQNPSFSKQLEFEESIRKLREDHDDNT